MKFLIGSTAMVNGSSETALLENKPMSSEAISVIYKLGMSAIIGGVCIAAITTAGVWDVVTIGVVAVLAICIKAAE